MSDTIDKVSIIISRGSLEGVYPGLIMANGARMEGIDANLFFTFFGLDAINRAKHDHIKVATVGKPGLHLATWLGGFPGMSSLVTHQLAGKMEELDIPPIPEFVEMISDSGARHSTPARHRSTCSASAVTTSSTRSTTSSPSASSTSSPRAVRSSSLEQAGTRSSHPARRLRDPECSASGRPRRSERSSGREPLLQLAGRRQREVPVDDVVPAAGRGWLRPIHRQATLRVFGGHGHRRADMSSREARRSSL